MVTRSMAMVLVVLATLTAEGARSQSAAVRHYYLAAEDVSWNYAPSGRDPVMHGEIREPWRESLTWRKTRFVEYTDDSFTVKKAQPAWLGVLGPILR